MKEILKVQAMAISYLKKARNRTTDDPEGGAIAVEFVFLLPLVLSILTCVVEFGNVWYVSHALANASREGARAAVLYVGNPAPDRGTWARQQAVATVNGYLGKFLPRGEWYIDQESDITIKPKDLAKPADLDGAALTVHVQARNYLLMLDKLIPAFASTKVEAATTMRME
jgi:Flp pilus assembly protein TadG